MHSNHDVADEPQQLGLNALKILFDVVECLVAEALLDMRKNGHEPPAELYKPTPTVIRRSTEFVQRTQRREFFLQAELTSALAASRGSWQRFPGITCNARGTSREHRPRARRTRVVARDGPPRSSDDDPPRPVALWRGFAAASERMIVHLGRRAGARAA